MTRLGRRTDEPPGKRSTYPIVARGARFRADRFYHFSGFVVRVLELSPDSQGPVLPVAYMNVVVGSVRQPLKVHYVVSESNKSWEREIFQAGRRRTVHVKSNVNVILRTWMPGPYCGATARADGDRVKIKA